MDPSIAKLSPVNSASSVAPDGPTGFQLQVCYDRLPCVIEKLEGSGFGPGNSIHVSNPSSSCRNQSFVAPIPSFPNGGLSDPSLNGQRYTFGPQVVNESALPVYFRMCWIPSHNVSASLDAGILRIDSYEEYYRTHVVSRDWSPYEPSWKIWLMSIMIPVIPALMFLFSFIKNRMQSQQNPDESSTMESLPAVILRNCPKPPENLSELLNLYSTSKVNIAEIRRARSSLIKHV